MQVLIFPLTKFLRLHQNKVSGKLDYLSIPSFICHYFAECKWKGFGVGQYEQGMINAMQIPTQGKKDKRGLGFEGPQTIIDSTQIHKIEDEGDYEELASPHEDLLCEAPSSPTYQCSIPSYIFKQVNKVSVSIISSLSLDLDILFF